MGRIIFGGSFNPLHVGHMRLAIEAHEILSPLARIVEFIPCAVPPHKKASALLPFELRARMIRAAIRNFDWMICNELENHRTGPSYTMDTLIELKQAYGGEKLFFLIGSQDYALLEQWHRGLELPSLCTLVVLPRGAYSTKAFFSQSRLFWPDCEEENLPLEADCPDARSICLPSGGQVYYVPLPYMRVSASHVRHLWLHGRNLDYLVPAQVMEILNKEKQAVNAVWEETGATCSR